MIGFGAKTLDQFQHFRVFARHDFIVMFRRVRNGCAQRPFRIHDVGYPCPDYGRKYPLLTFTLRKHRFMRVGLVPVRRFHVTGAVGKMDLNREPCPTSTSGDFTRTAIVSRLRIANRFHIHRLAVEFEMADDFAVPQIQLSARCPSNHSSVPASRRRVSGRNRFAPGATGADWPAAI